MLPECMPGPRHADIPCKHGLLLLRHPVSLLQHGVGCRTDGDFRNSRSCWLTSLKTWGWGQPAACRLWDGAGAESCREATCSASALLPWPQGPHQVLDLLNFQKYWLGEAETPLGLTEPFAALLVDTTEESTARLMFSCADDEVLLNPIFLSCLRSTDPTTPKWITNSSFPDRHLQHSSPKCHRVP